MPFVSDDRGCFCCGPSAAPSASEMQHQQFGQRVTVQSLNTAAIMPGSVGMDTVTLGSLFERAVSLEGMSQQSQSYFGEVSSPVVDMSSQGLGATSNHGYNLITSQQSTTSESQGQTSTGVSFRYLQNRELGGKTAAGPSAKDPSKSYLSSSAPEDMTGFSGMSYPYGDSGAGSDFMDLDSALDELGMLSTITNSRRQYLLESRGTEAARKREQRLRTKSESSPNLTALGSSSKGYRIIQIHSSYVTGVSCSDHSSSTSQSTSRDFLDSSYSPTGSLDYRNPDDKPMRRRSIPRRSRMRKDRFARSRCPYRIPNRLCHSMQESDFSSDYLESCTSTSIAANPTEPLESQGLGNCLSGSLRGNLMNQLSAQSKSNTSSPVKPCQEVRLVRSLSAEDLTPVRRRLEQDLNSSRTEESLDLMTTQLTSLHMS